MTPSIIKNPSFSQAQQRLSNIFGVLSLIEGNSENITVTKDGNIEIPYYNLDGSPKTFHPHHEAKKNQNYGDGVDYHSNQKDIQIDYCRYRIYRNFKNAKGAKYISPKRNKALSPDYISLYLPSYIRSIFQKGEKIKTLYIVEGEFKSIVACQNGIACISFAGISTFQLTKEIKELILKCGVENIVLLYDNDCTELSSNPFGIKPIGYESEKDREKREKMCINDRSRNFYFSKVNFSKSFFEWLSELNKGKDKDEKTKISLSFAMSNKEQLKAIDDIILSQESIILQETLTDLLSLKTNDTFTFIKLRKTRYEYTLTKFYGLNSATTFYLKHRDILKNKPFKFRHDGCYCIYKYCTRRKNIIVLESPFDVAITPVKTFKCSKYIGEYEQAVFKLFDKHQKVFLSLPTGGGKTTIAMKFAEYFIDNDKSKIGTVYIVVPTINLGRQLAFKEKKKFIYQKIKDYTGKLDNKKNEYDKRIIVVTYDCVKNKKILVSENDLLIIDEAHNFVNQYNFRGETLRALHAEIDKAKKVICLSATPNNLLVKNEGFTLIKATIKSQTKVNYIPHILEKKQTIVQGIISELLNTDLDEKTQIEGKEIFDFKKKKKVCFVFLDDKKTLEQIRDLLINLGFITLEETAFFTSERQELDATLESIKDDQEIVNDKIRIVFTTRLISEGVNINNQNIGKILMGNIKCIDTLIQFPNRFRMMSDLDVHLFYKEQLTIQKDYYLNSERCLDYLRATAEGQRKALQLAVNDGIFEDVATGCMSENFDLAYVDDGIAHVDILKLYYKEYRRKIQYIPLTDLFSELLRNENVTINYTFDDVHIDDEIKEKLTEIKENQEKAKEDRKELLLNDLEKQEQIVLSAVKIIAKEQKKANFIKELDKHIVEPEAQEQLVQIPLILPPEPPKTFPPFHSIKQLVQNYVDAHANFNDDKTYIKVVSNYLKIKEYTNTPIKLLRSIKTVKDFKILCKSLKWLSWIEGYNNRNTRFRKMSSLEKLDAKLFIDIQKDMTKKFKGRTFKMYEFYSELRKKYTLNDVKDLNHLTKTESFCNTMFLALFDSVEIDKDTYTGLSPKIFQNVLKTTHLM